MPLDHDAFMADIEERFCFDDLTEIRPAAEYIYAKYLVPPPTEDGNGYEEPPSWWNKWEDK